MIIKIREIFKSPDELANGRVVLQGWVRTNRNSNKFGFLEVNDGTFFKSVQVVYETDKIDNFDIIAKSPIATALQIEGTLILTPDAKQPFEIKAERIEILAESSSDYPLQKKRHSFQDRGFVYVHTPIITGSDAEGAGEMFRVTTLDMEKPPMKDGKVDFTQDFFGKEAGLTVSGQLEGEIFALAFRDIYTFGPTFRAENSNTARHASEFWMVEPEMSFCDLVGNMEVAEDMIKYIISYALKKAPEEMEFFNNFIDKGLLERLNNIVNSDFGRITYTEAVEILKKSEVEFEYPVEWGIDLQTEHERYLTEQVFKKPLFVTDYPKEIKAFYMRLNDDDKTVAACDLLVPGIGEIIGGSQREERLDILKERMNSVGLKEEDYWWYLELRKYGGVKHSGYGLGFERMVMYITGMSNIRDVLPFPRTPKNAEF